MAQQLGHIPSSKSERNLARIHFRLLLVRAWEEPVGVEGEGVLVYLWVVENLPTSGHCNEKRDVAGSRYGENADHWLTQTILPLGIR